MKITTAAAAAVVALAPSVVYPPTAHAWKVFCAWMDPQYWKGYADCIGGPPAAGPAAPAPAAAPAPVIPPAWQAPSEGQYTAPGEGVIPAAGPVPDPPPPAENPPAAVSQQPDTSHPQLSCDGVFSYVCNLIPAVPPAPEIAPHPGG